MGLQKLQTQIQLLLYEGTARTRVQTPAGAIPPEAQTHRKQSRPLPQPGDLLVPPEGGEKPGCPVQAWVRKGVQSTVQRLRLSNLPTTLFCENQGTVWV